MKLHITCTFVFIFFVIGNVLAEFKNLPECGVSKVPKTKIHGRIIGGRKSLIGEHPWAAHLGYRLDKYYGRVVWLCGGSLITGRHIVTAAHCIKNGLFLYAARLGDLYYNTSPSKDSIQVSVEKAILHDNYAEMVNNTDEYYNDIGIVYLEKDVVFTDFIRPVCLPEKQEFDFINILGHAAMVLGWGKNSTDPNRALTRSERLMIADITVVSNEICKTNYFELVAARITDLQLCAGSLTGGIDACLGDSGGPLVMENQEKHYLIGVTSYGYECGLKKYPGVYTRVTSYLDWIHNHIASK